MTWNLFAFMSIFLMMMMTIGVIMQYSSVVAEKYISQTITTGFIVVAIGALCWIFFGYDIYLHWTIDLSLEKFLDSNYVIGMLVEMFFFLYAITMIIGSVLERENLLFLVAYIPLWMLIVYLPLANYIWGSSGFFQEWQSVVPAYDFSGGLVVHASAGIASLVLVQGMSHRKQQTRHTPYQSITLLIGALFIIIGWFTFNMAPVKDFNEQSFFILLNTIIYVFVGALSGCLSQGFIYKKLNHQALMNGAITGLVSSTASVGYVGVGPSFLIAVIVPGLIPFIIQYVKRKFDFDDAVDSFAMNGIGGILGTFLGSFFIIGGRNILNQWLAILMIILWSWLGAYLVKRSVAIFLPLEKVEDE